jgi:hypothetical protein
MDVIWARVFSVYFNEQVMSEGAERNDLEGSSELFGQMERPVAVDTTFDAYTRE